jgi:hypothetical protein
MILYYDQRSRDAALNLFILIGARALINMKNATKLQINLELYKSVSVFGILPLVLAIIDIILARKKQGTA